MNDVNKFMDFAFKRANEKFSDDDDMLEITIAMIPLMGVSYALAVARGLSKEEAYSKAFSFGKILGECVNNEISSYLTNNQEKFH